MPTIVFASPKGGAGKSTSAVVLATELARNGATVILIDADPNRPIARWAKRGKRPPGISVVETVAEDTIIDAIEAAAQQAAFVLVDLEGTASAMQTYAMSRADLVIIPTKGSILDATEAVKAIRNLRTQEKALRRAIPAAVLFTQTNPAIRPRTLRNIEEQFEQSDVPVFRVRLHERDAYRALFVFGGGLSSLDPGEVRNIEAAQVNAQAFAREAVGFLKPPKARPAEAAA